MRIAGFQKTTLLDYPGHTASLLFTGGCNFRCPYCHNGDLVLRAGELPVISEEEIFSHLKKRRNVLDGVCVSGGEPTLQTDLPEFLRKIKELGYDIKLDTNGTSPDVLRKLIHKGLVDYVAMDIKNAPEKYAKTAGLPQNPDAAGADASQVSGVWHEHVFSSVKLLLKENVDYEFRTTVVRELHTISDIEAIAKWITGAKRYYLQPYRESEAVIQKGLSRPSEEVLKEMVSVAEPYVEEITVRG